MDSSGRPRFARPFFVTPHAVDQFRAKIADLAPADVITEVQRMMQDKRLPPTWTPKGSPSAKVACILPVDAELREGGLTLIYLGWLGSNPVYIPTLAPDGVHGGWPSVPTVMGKESRLHNVLVRAAAWKKRCGRFPLRRWVEEDDRLLAALRDAGFSIRQVASIMRRGHHTVWRHTRHPLDRRQDWPADDVQAAVALRAGGKSCREAGLILGRTSGGVAMRLYRYRREHPRDKRARTTVPGPWPKEDVTLAVAMRAEGKTLARIGEAVHRSRAAVSWRIVRESRKPLAPEVTGPWTEAELELAHNLRAKGKSCPCIARKLKRSVGAVYRKLALIREKRLADPRGRAIAGMVGRIIKVVRKEGIECLPEPFSQKNAP